MSRRVATNIAEAFGGEVIPGEDGHWSVKIERKDGRVVVISEDSVDEFYDGDALAEGQCYLSISLV